MKSKQMLMAGVIVGVYLIGTTATFAETGFVKIDEGGGRSTLIKIDHDSTLNTTTVSSLDYGSHRETRENSGYDSNAAIKAIGQLLVNWLVGRGEIESNLFADKVFASKFNDGAWVEAVQTRNVPAMASLAWNLKGVETILGKVDKKTTSAMMFEAAAQIAVAQGNADALKDIVALAPECKKFNEEMALAGKTRGISKTIAMPELCVYDPDMGDKLMKPWQKPIFGGYIAETFRGMPKQNAESISFLVNQGRMTMNPAMLAFGAMELYKFRGDNKISAQFEPANIMAEAADLAVEIGDKEALRTIIGMYESSSLINAEKISGLKEQMTLLSSTRGTEKQNVLKDLCQGLKWNVKMPAMKK